MRHVEGKKALGGLRPRNTLFENPNMHHNRRSRGEFPASQSRVCTGLLLRRFEARPDRSGEKEERSEMWMRRRTTKGEQDLPI